MSSSSRALVARNSGRQDALRRRARARHRHFDQFLHLGRDARDSTRMRSAEKDRFVEIMGDEDDGDVDLASRFPEDAPACGARLCVERAERLVHQQDARLVGERADDCDALFHAAGQLMRIGVGEFLEADELQPLQRLASRLA